MRLFNSFPTYLLFSILPLFLGACTGSIKGVPAVSVPPTSATASILQSFALDMEMKPSAQLDPTIATQPTLSDISLAVACAQGGRSEHFVAALPITMPIATDAKDCQLEILSFKMGGTPYTRKTYFSSATTGGKSTFTAVGVSSNLVLQVETPFPNTPREKASIIFTYNYQQVIDPLNGVIENGATAPAFTVASSPGQTSSTLTFTCNSPVTGTAAATACEGAKISDLRLAVSVRPPEIQDLGESDIYNMLPMMHLVSELSPQYLPNGTGNGGFSVVIPNPAESRYKRILITLLNRQANGSMAYKYFVIRLFPVLASFKGGDPAASALMSGLGLTTVMDGAMPVFSVAGNKIVFISDYIEVDTAANYTLSALLKSTGTPASLFYLGLETYDVNKKVITDFSVMRKGSVETVTAVSDTNITVAETISGWGLGTDMDYSRSLGFYYSGDTTQVPDDVVIRAPGTSNPTDGAFSNASGTSISLNAPLSAVIKSKIRPGVTKVMNHTGGSSYIYTSYGSATSSWASYSGSVTGEAFGNAPTVFRTGTKYVRIGLLLNYTQNASSTMELDQIELIKQ